LAAGSGIPEAAWPTPVLKAFDGGNKNTMGTFTPSLWELAVNETCLHSILKDRLPAETEAEFKIKVTKAIRELAKTLYHEARHCQQFFWISAMVQQQPQNFEGTPNIAKWPAVSVGDNKDARVAIGLAANTPIPDEPSALIGIKRMAISEYFRTIKTWQTKKFYPSFAPSESSLDREVASARTAAVDLLQNSGIGGTSLDVDKMAAEPTAQMQDYAGRPCENDGFFCETIAGGYWDLFSGKALRTMPADECSPFYVLTSSGPSFLARIGASADGGKTSAGQR